MGGFCYYLVNVLMEAAVQLSCYKCGYFAETAEIVCPQCKGILHTATSTRIRGILLAISGASLTAFMVYFLIWALAAFNATDPTGAKFTRDDQQKSVILGLFGVLIAFGVMSLAAGIWQLIFGRRSIGLVWAMVAMALLVGLGCAYVVWTF